MDLCKKCLTMHIDNFNPETFLWILQDMDLPYIPEEWNVLRDRAFAKNPNLTGMSVFGKYLSSLWRNKIPKLLAEQAKEDYLIWYYTYQEYGKWKKCSKCGQIKLAHNRFFSKNNTSKDRIL